MKLLAITLGVTFVAWMLWVTFSANPDLALQDEAILAGHVVTQSGLPQTSRRMVRCAAPKDMTFGQDWPWYCPEGAK